jgi:hypothetical protein
MKKTSSRRLSMLPFSSSSDERFVAFGSQTIGYQPVSSTSSLHRPFMHRSSGHGSSQGSVSPQIGFATSASSTYHLSMSGDPYHERTKQEHQTQYFEQGRQSQSQSEPVQYPRPTTLPPLPSPLPIPSMAPSGYRPGIYKIHGPDRSRRY